MQRTMQDVLDPVGSQVIASLSNSTPAGLAIPAHPDVATAYIAKRARITVETQSIRYYEDGTAPSTTNGHLVAAGTTFFVEGINALVKFQAISVSASAKLTITYYG